jgi:hypothetical protein
VQAYQYIKKEWIVSPAARRVYRISAAVSLTLYLFLVAVVLNEPIQRLRLFLFVAVLATALNAAGMQYFLFHFDDSPALKQVFWFCVMICIPLGPALYCFLVYSRSAPLKNSRADVHGTPRSFPRQGRP